MGRKWERLHSNQVPHWVWEVIEQNHVNEKIYGAVTHDTFVTNGTLFQYKVTHANDNARVYRKKRNGYALRLKNTQLRKRVKRQKKSNKRIIAWAVLAVAIGSILGYMAAPAYIF